MNRKDFLKYTAVGGVALPQLFGKLSAQAFQQLPQSVMDTLNGLATDTDHVLVIIQLQGGNDGLNTLVPIDQYGAYSAARGSIAIPQNRLLTLNGAPQTGLHPSMTGMQNLFNDGKLSIVQSVGYADPNFSHFRATDIWTSGSNSRQVLNTGWVGRYLSTEFPNYPTGFPNTTMPDPLAIQIGNSTSLAFQGSSSNSALSITDPSSFYNLIGGITGTVPNTPAGRELAYIRQTMKQTNAYAQVITAAANRVTQHATYPTSNSLAASLKIVAKLIAGGLKTRVYMVSLGGFDTHAGQVSTIDATVGAHANLLSTLSTAVSAFMADLAFLNVDHRVVGMTFSEFGRRIKANASVGTDHGTTAPMFMFGKPILGGQVIGANPVLPANATVNDNLPLTHDYRQIYKTILTDWFCVNNTDLQSIIFENVNNLNAVRNPQDCAPLDVTEANRVSGQKVLSNYPNPCTDFTTIELQHTEAGEAVLQIYDLEGHLLLTLNDSYLSSGKHQFRFDTANLPSGVYYCHYQATYKGQSLAIIKQ
jgi:uncharacterized protein (DUF1501 family)